MEKLCPLAECNPFCVPGSVLGEQAEGEDVCDESRENCRFAGARVKIPILCFTRGSCSTMVAVVAATGEAGCSRASRATITSRGENNGIHLEI